MRRYLVGTVLLLALAGCGRGLWQYGERASWRHQAEVECLKSGSVKLGSGVVQISPIEGPGMCGADFPLKVSLLGESSPMTSYADDPRPPGAIPNGSMPNWPPTEPPYTRPAPVQQSRPMPPAHGETLRWVPGPPGIEQRRYAPPEQSNYAPPVEAPGYEPPRTAPPLEQPRYVPPPDRRYAPPVEQRTSVPVEQPQYPPPVAPPRYAAPPPQQTSPAGQPMSIYAPGVAQPDDIPDDAILPPGRERSGNPRTTYNAPVYEAPPPQSRALPPLGPMRGPQSAAIATPATLTPSATLACPLVSALDRWVSDGVQPAALRWFGSPVTEIKQISAYSCRSMVGAGTSHISEHAFGNALDVAGFVLADGRKISVQTGWHGAPEEQGFLRDVHMAACNYFSTVLAPGYNAAHYNHIHVDLMRRASGRHPCRPDAVSGEVAAAKARTLYASRHRGPAYTGSLSGIQEAKRILGIPGEDGEFDDDESEKPGWPRTVPAAPRSAPPQVAAPETTEITGSITPAPPSRLPNLSNGDAAIRMQEMREAR